MALESVMIISQVIDWVNHESGMSEEDKFRFWNNVNFDNPNCWINPNNEIDSNIIKTHLSPEMWRQITSSVVMSYIF